MIFFVKIQSEDMHMTWNISLEDLEYWYILYDL